MKNKFIFLLGITILMNILAISALPCDLSVTLINQDPYPAQPNEYVEVVFQVSGVENPSCKGVNFKFMEKFPFTVEDGKALKTLDGSTYVIDYSSDWMVPYRLLVDKNAIDGEQEIEVGYSSAENPNFQTKKFTIKIEDSQADFELSVKDYSDADKEVIFEILNTADVDVEALTLEISKQENIDIRGANRVVVGDLDSNEFTTADFKAELKDGNIKVTIIYTDQVGVRRTIEKTVNFDSYYFKERADEKKSTPFGYYFIFLIIIALIVWWIFKRNKRKKERALRRKGMASL